MLYLIHKRSSELDYKGGQEPIVHLEADLLRTVEWAEKSGACRWAFTSSNAASYYFNDFGDLAELNQLNWDAIFSHNWSLRKEEKQAEFLIEHRFPFSLIERVGVLSRSVYQRAADALLPTNQRVNLEIQPGWYY